MRRVLEIRWRLVACLADMGLAELSLTRSKFMGWFLPTFERKTSGKTASAKAKKAKGKAAAQKAEFDPRRAWRMAQVGCFVMLGAGVLVGWNTAEHYLTNYVAEHRAAQAKSEQVALAHVPAWMSTGLQAELRQTVALPVGENPLDGDDLTTAAAHLQANAWVEAVREVRRLPGGRVVVDATYRQPMAVVEGRDGYHLVDGRGVRLPGLYLSHQLKELDLPLVTGVTDAPHRVGEVWPGDDLQAGIALGRLLRTQPYREQIVSVDVGSRDSLGRVRLVIRTETGQVRWGLPPGEEKTIEPPMEAKLQRLAQVYRERGQIDAGGRMVDIYGADVFVHQPAFRTTAQPTAYTESR